MVPQLRFLACMRSTSMYAFLLTEAWGCRDFLLSTRIEQAFVATKDGRKQIHRLIGQNSHEDVVRHLAAECARHLQERFDTENGGQSIKVCLTIAPAGASRPYVPDGESAAASLRPVGAETADVTQAPAPPQVQPYTHPRLLFFWPRSSM